MTFLKKDFSTLLYWKSWYYSQQYCTRAAQYSFFYPAETPESTEFFKNQSVKGRLGEITDIVPLANFLVSSEAGWVAAQTTQTIFINGGFLMR
jgi:NAD(P)-dependent dehydrogenase (short-subunit alcohol dehydrogenase family)